MRRGNLRSEWEDQRVPAVLHTLIRPVWGEGTPYLLCNFVIASINPGWRQQRMAYALLK